MSNETNAVTTADTNPKKVPESFRDLSKAELVAAARAFGSDDSGSSSVIRAALEEDGVTWEQYVKAFMVEQPEPEPVTEESLAQFEAEEDEVVTASPDVMLPRAGKYLIKMERENPYFEFGKYKFTTENPFAIMPAADAQRLLTTETGFRQAFPDELREAFS